MRPIRIELEGFMAHRQLSSIDLGEADFFSLSGPTGSGKSSLIDAMIFALYGRVPRLGAKAVAPVISSGAERARVSVEFESGDETYTAVRSVKRTDSGATTDLARLQIEEEVIASGADAVSTEVERILSLGFDDFTRTVVLPQGDFAEFLKATPGERQSLLRKLLEYDFSDVRALAKTRAAVAESRRSEAEARLEALDVPSEETLEDAKAGRERLEQLALVMVDRERDLAELEATAKTAADDVERVTNARDRLGAIAPPANIDELTQAVTDSHTAVENAEEQLTAERLAFKEAEFKSEELPSEESIRGLHERYRQLDETKLRIEGLEVEKAITVRDSVLADHRQASTELAGTRERISEIKAIHGAHALREHLSPGDQCPVCSQVVTDVPESDPPEGLDGLEKKETDLTSQVVDLQEKLDRARESVAAGEASRQELATLQQNLEEKLDGARPVGSLDLVLAEIKAATLLVADRRRTVVAAEENLKLAKTALEDSSEALASLGRQLMAARESVADLEPPLPTADDPLVQWKELLAWTVEARESLDTSLSEAGRAMGTAATAVEDERRSLEKDLTDLGIPAIRPYAIEVTRALDQASQQVQTYEKAVADAADLKRATKNAKNEAAVAEALAGHLNINRFEQWLMQGALADLVEGANELLEDLSVGGYSLSSVDDGTFEIIDHRAAGETRPVSTLSGGETFLVSLALALSLAETLSSSRGAGLDAIVLDEGFGTLDDESLDTVASVLEELTGRGLMVGVISHVKELAARAPVRFEVRKTPAGSLVEPTS